MDKYPYGFYFNNKQMYQILRYVGCKSFTLTKGFIKRKIF